MADLSRESENRAYAKAVLVTRVANAASAMKLDPTAQALLLQLMADTRPEGNTWSADTSLTALATRLNVHRATALRAAEKIDRIIAYRPGSGTRKAKWTVRLLPSDAPARHSEIPSDAPMQHPVTRGCRAHAAPGDAPARHIPRNKRIPTTTTTPDGGGGGGGEFSVWDRSRIKTRLIEAGVAQADAARLANLPTTDPCRVAFALECAKLAKPSPSRPGRYIASLLDKPEAGLDGYPKFRKKLIERRQYRYGEILGAATDSARQSAAERIREGWPEPEDLAESNLLDDEDLFCTKTPLWGLFDRLAKAAAGRLASAQQTR